MARPVVLFGGAGSERRVSVASAQNVVGALAEAAAWFLPEGGGVVECARGELLQHGKPFEDEFAPAPLRRWPSLDEALRGAASAVEVVLCVHGGTGEDGTLQRQLEAAGVAFTGSGSEASARAFDKQVAKGIVAAAGVEVATGAEVSPGPPEAVARELARLWDRFGPMALKPVANGSSVGLQMLRRREDLESAAAYVAAGGDPYLAERLVEGVELTVGVVDRPQPCALPPSEVRVDPGRSFDYSGKYLGRGAAEITPAEISRADAARAQELAVLAHRALGCFGYSRTDMILEAATGRPVFLETNTLPGLTAVSFIPQQLRAAGIDFSEFLDAQLALARERLQAAPTSRAMPEAAPAQRRAAPPPSTCADRAPPARPTASRGRR